MRQAGEWSRKSLREWLGNGKKEDGEWLGKRLVMVVEEAAEWTERKLGNG